MKLGKLLKERGGLGLGNGNGNGKELKRKDLPSRSSTASSNQNPRLNSKSENCSSVKVIKQKHCEYYSFKFSVIKLSELVREDELSF